MKAALLQEFGKPLVIADRRDPEPVPGQILIRVEACGLCHSDLHLARRDWEGFKARMPIPAILGHEVAGRVAQLGVGSTRGLPAGERSQNFSGSPPKGKSVHRWS